MSTPTFNRFTVEYYPDKSFVCLNFGYREGWKGEGPDFRVRVQIDNNATPSEAAHQIRKLADDIEAASKGESGENIRVGDNLFSIATVVAQTAG